MIHTHTADKVKISKFFLLKMNPLILITSLLAISSLAAGNGWEPPVIKVIHKTVHIPKVSSLGSNLDRFIFSHFLFFYLV